MPKKARRLLFCPKKRKFTRRTLLEQDEVSSVDHTYCVQTGMETSSQVTSQSTFPSELPLSDLDDVEKDCSVDFEISFPDNTLSLLEAAVYLTLPLDHSVHDVRPLSDYETSPTPKYHREIFKESFPDLKTKLPHLWKLIEDEADSLTILMFSSQCLCIVQRIIHINTDFNVTASFHGKKLSAEHKFYEDVRKFNFQRVAPNDLVTEVCKIVSCYRQYEVCQGIDNPELHSFCRNDEACVLDENNFEERRYTRTWRAKHCQYAVPQLQRKCLECSKLSKKFAKRHMNSDISPGSEVKIPNKFKSFKYLSSPEKRAKMERCTKDIRNLKLVNQRLRDRIGVLEKMLQDEGVDVDKDPSKTLTPGAP